MKYFLALICFLIFFSESNFGQNTTKNQGKDEISTYDVPPTPPGGQEGYLIYLQHHIRYPQAAVNANAQGTVYVNIVVGKNGKLSDVHIEKDNAHYGCGEEAVRVIKKMRRWKPGMMNGVAVKVRYIIPVKFTLH